MNRSSLRLAPTPQHGSRLRRSSIASSVWPQQRRRRQAQIRAWKKKLAAVKKQPKAKKESFAAHINAAVDGLSPEQAAELLLTILHNDMRAIVERYITAQRKDIVAAFENWWDKYRVTLTEIESKRDAAALALQRYLRGLRYV
jgi:type I restriction enzyme M protein